MHSIRIGRVAGIELRADWSVVVIFWLLMWQFATIALPSIAPGYTSVEYWITAFVAGIPALTQVSSAGQFDRLPATPVG